MKNSFKVLMMLNIILVMIFFQPYLDSARASHHPYACDIVTEYEYFSEKHGYVVKGYTTNHTICCVGNSCDGGGSRDDDDDDRGSGSDNIVTEGGDRPPEIPPTPTKPDYVPPVVPSISVPSTSGFPSWYPDPNLDADNLPKDVESTETTSPIASLTDGKELEIRHTNIPKNGIIHLNGVSFKPELVLRNKNSLWNIPFTDKMDSVTQEELDKLFSKFTASKNTVDLFIYEVKNASSLPSNQKDLFNKPKNEFAYYTTIKDTFPDLTGFKIDKSGHFIIGAKVTSNGKEHYEVMPVKVTIQDSYGYLPIKNNLSIQYNQTMVTTGWKNSAHNIADLTFENYKSIKTPTAYNSMHSATAIGSSKGKFGLKLLKDDTSAIPMTTTVPSTAKITEILDWECGFLVSTENDGLYYVDVSDGKTIKVSGINSTKLNDVYMEKDSLYVANNSGLSTGEIKLKLIPNTEIADSVSYIETKNITNTDIFSTNSEIMNIETLLGKIVLTPKSGNASVAIINKL